MSLHSFLGSARVTITTEAKNPPTPIKNQAGFIPGCLSMNPVRANKNRVLITMRIEARAIFFFDQQATPKKSQHSEVEPHNALGQRKRQRLVGSA